MENKKQTYYIIYTAANNNVCVASTDFINNPPAACQYAGMVKIKHSCSRPDDAAAYIMPASVAKQYKPVQYVEPTKPRAIGTNKKSRPDAKTMQLYWLLIEAVADAAVDPDKIINENGYKFPAGAAANLLKNLKAEFNITDADLKKYPKQQPAPATVESTKPRPAVNTSKLDKPAAAVLAAGVDTGHVVICSAPKAEPKPDPAPDTKPIPTESAAKENNKPAPVPVSCKLPAWLVKEIHCTNKSGVEFKVVSCGKKQIKVEFINGARSIYNTEKFIRGVESGNIIVFCPLLDVPAVEPEQQAAAATEPMPEPQTETQPAIDYFYNDNIPEGEQLPAPPAVVHIDTGMQPAAHRPRNNAPRRPRWLRFAATLLLLVVSLALLASQRPDNAVPMPCVDTLPAVVADPVPVVDTTTGTPAPPNKKPIPLRSKNLYPSGQKSQRPTQSKNY